MQLQKFCTELIPQLSARNISFWTEGSLQPQSCCSSQSLGIHLINPLRRHRVGLDLTGVKNSLQAWLLRLFQRRKAGICLGKEECPSRGRAPPPGVAVGKCNINGDGDFGGGDETSLSQVSPWQLPGVCFVKLFSAYPGGAPRVDVGML